VDHQIGLVCGDRFDVGLETGQLRRLLGGLGRVVALVVDGDHLVAGTDREQDLGRARRQADDGLGDVALGDVGRGRIGRSRSSRRRGRIVGRCRRSGGGGGRRIGRGALLGVVAAGGEDDERNGGERQGSADMLHGFGSSEHFWRTPGPPSGRTS
jgi:hypothetical protein